MRFPTWKLTAVLWTAVACGLGALMIQGCSGPKDTSQNDSSRSKVEVVQTPSTESGLSATLNLPLTGTAPAPVPTPAEVRAAWSEGVAQFESKDYASAVEKLTVAVGGKTEDAYTHYLLGLAYWKNGQSDQAEPSLTESARLNPDSLKTWINLARVRLELGQAQPALDAADKALEIDGSNSDALHQKGRAQATLGQRDEAVDTLRSAHDADPGNGQISNTLGYWLIQLGRPAEAVEFLESAREQLPTVAYVRNNLGVAYERTGRRDEAVTEYQAAVQSGDSGGRAASSLARLGVVDTGIQVAVKAQEPPAGPVAEATKNPDSE